MRLRLSLAGMWMAALPFGLSGCGTSAVQEAYWQWDPDGPSGGTPIYVFGGTILDVGAVIGLTPYDAGDLGTVGFLMIFDLPLSLAADALLLPLCIYQQFERATWEEDEFIERLAHSDAEVRARAATALGVLGGTTQATVAALIGALDDPDVGVRHQAVVALGRTGGDDPSVLAALERALHDDRDNVRKAAQEAIDRRRPARK